MAAPQLLLALLLWQAGSGGTPPPTGEVTLSLEEYNALMHDAEGLPREDPLAPNFVGGVRQANYSVTVTGSLARVRMVATVDVLVARPEPTTLLGSGGALLSLKVDGKPRGATVDGEYYAVDLAKGSHTVDMEVVVPVASEGPSELGVEIPRAVAARLTATLPGVGWQVQVEGADELITRRDGKTTVVTTALPVTDRLSMNWIKQGADEAIPDEDTEEPETPASTTPGKARATVLHHLAVDESVMRGTVKATLSIQKGTRTQVSLLVPANVEVLDVSTADLREWTANKEGDTRRVLVNFRYARTGEVPVTLKWERSMGEGGEATTAEVPEVTVLDVEGERGFLGIETAPGVEVAFSRTEGAEALDGRDLPGDLWAMSGTPLVLGAKYLEHPVRLALSISKRAKVAVADTTLDRADFETVVNQEGRAVSAVTWHVRNHQRQYLEVKLPAATTVLSCFVNGKPQRPARGANDTLFIPLDRSTAAQGAGASFPVELIIAQDTGKLWPLSRLALEMPATGVQAMELAWRVFVPNTHLGLAFGGNFALQQDPRRMDRWFTQLLFAGGDALAGGDGSLQRNKADMLEGYDMSQGVKARWAPKQMELQLPTAVRVSRPLVGRRYDLRANLLRAEAPQVSITLVKRNILDGLGMLAVVCVFVATLGLAERVRRRNARFRREGTPPPAPGAAWERLVPLLPATLVGGALLALAVGMLVDQVVGHAVLCTLMFPGWLLAAHLWASVRKGVRWFGWVPWGIAVATLGLATVTAVFGQTFTGSLVFLFWAAVLAVAARKLMWRPVSTLSPESGQPVAAASNAAAAPSKEGGAS